MLTGTQGKYRLALVTLVGLVASNFVYQLFQINPDFAVSFERSWFQATAIGIYLLFEKVMNG